MRSAISLATLTILLAFTTACGDSNSGTTTTPTQTPTPAPTQPSQASITVEVLGFGAAGSGQGNLFAIGLRITESAGLGASINFVRLEVFRATGEFEERQEIGSGQITTQTGSNKLGPNSTRELNPVLFPFNATIKSGRVIRVTIGFTDDAGNDFEFVDDFTFA